MWLIHYAIDTLIASACSITQILTCSIYASLWWFTVRIWLTNTNCLVTNSFTIYKIEKLKISFSFDHLYLCDTNFLKVGIIDCEDLSYWGKKMLAKKVLTLSKRAYWNHWDKHRCKYQSIGNKLDKLVSMCNINYQHNGFHSFHSMEIVWIGPMNNSPKSLK